MRICVCVWEGERYKSKIENEKEEEDKMIGSKREMGARKEGVRNVREITEEKEYKRLREGKRETSERNMNERK